MIDSLDLLYYALKKIITVVNYKLKDLLNPLYLLKMVDRNTVVIFTKSTKRKIIMFLTINEKVDFLIKTVNKSNKNPYCIFDINPELYYDSSFLEETIINEFYLQNDFYLRKELKKGA